ncbi:MAG: glycosyltransferase family 2 protein [Candidatus Margulisiibacteriota bacterium]
MKLSGYSMGRNLIKFGYPIYEAITSILPICDEFIMNVGDSEDDTLELVQSINSPKLKIIRSVWDPEKRVGAHVIADQTNIALKECTGDWAFHIQADECVHEKYLPVIKENLERHLNDPDVDGFTLRYVHFYGSYSKVVPPEWDWYKETIRIVRNNHTMISDNDAISFRKLKFYQAQMTPNCSIDFNRQYLRRLIDFLTPSVRNIPSGAEMYHYGWARPAEIMMKKKIELDSLYSPKAPLLKDHPMKDHKFDYGEVASLPDFKGTHPAVMRKRIEERDKGN